MESLQNEYGFTNEQMNGIKAAITNTLQPMIQTLIEAITPTIIENYQRKLKTEGEEIRQMNEKRKEALKYSQNNVNDWNKQLSVRNDKFWQYMRCVTDLELYTECLQDEADGLYVPRKFRRDKTFIKSDDEKRINEKMNHQRLRSEMEILKIRRDDYHSELKYLDDDNTRFFTQDIADKEKLENVIEIWEKCTKNDEEAVNSKFEKKKEEMRKHFEKDKRELKEVKKNSPTERTQENGITETDVPPPAWRNHDISNARDGNSSRQVQDINNWRGNELNHNNPDNSSNNNNNNNRDNWRRQDTGQQNGRQKNGWGNRNHSRHRPRYNLRSSTFLQSLSNNTS